MAGGRSTSKGASSRPPNPQAACPWLMFSHGKSKIIQTFYSIQDNSCFKRMLPHLSSASTTIHANCDNWAVITTKVDDDENNNFLSCFLLNLISMEKIMLPSLEDIEYRTCLLSSSPASNSCVVAFIDSMDDDDDGNRRSRIKFWRPSKENWAEAVTEWLVSLIMCDGKIYGRGTYNNNLVMVDIHDNDHIQVKKLIKIPYPTWDGSIRSDTILIESCGEIFLIRKLMVGVVGTRIRAMQVYKLEDAAAAGNNTSSYRDINYWNWNWIRVTDIGDHAFFVDSNSSCFSCAPAGFLQRNSIYFVGDGQANKCMYRYSLMDNRLYKTLPCPNVAHRIKQACWVIIQSSDSG